MRCFFSLFIACAFAGVADGAPLFDRVVAKGKGLEVKASQVEETYILFKANRAAIGQSVGNSPEEIKKAEAEILDSLIASKVILLRTTEADRTNGVAEAEKFIKDKKAAAVSEAAYRRQLIISGVTPEAFEKEVVDQAVIKAIVDRELRPKQTVTDADIEKFYKENPKMFEEPEKWKVAHIFMGIRDRGSREEITQAEKAEKQAKMKELLVRARGGFDFARGQMPPEFEAAAISMKPGQISDVVTTGLGWHIIKFIEYIPPKMADLTASKERIKNYLLQQATQKALGDWVKQLRKEADVVVTLDQPPS